MARANFSNNVPAADESIKGRQGFGLIQLFTGNGKGKTTAALGEAMRAVGAGKKVGIVFFDKGGTHYSERSVLDKLGIVWVATGRDRIDPVSGRFDFSIQEIDRTEAARGLVEARKMFESGFDLVILDEINSTTDLGMLTEVEALALIDRKPERTELILTGRNAPESFIKKAHLVTEMQLRKHYFYSGVKAREGLDF
jgi:cob(I)alamin adenosyltransferase